MKKKSWELLAQFQTLLYSNKDYKVYKSRATSLDSTSVNNSYSTKRINQENREIVPNKQQTRKLNVHESTELQCMIQPSNSKNWKLRMDLQNFSTIKEKITIDQCRNRSYANPNSAEFLLSFTLAIFFFSLGLEYKIASQNL